MQLPEFRYLPDILDSPLYILKKRGSRTVAKPFVLERCYEQPVA